MTARTTRAKPPPRRAPAAAQSRYRFEPGCTGDLARLTNALRHAGVRDPMTGRAFTEARVFGLSGGIGFMYFLFEYAGHAPLLSFTCRHFSLPAPLVERVVAHAGIAAETHTTGSARQAAAALDAILQAGGAAHCTVDAAALPWRGQDPAWLGHWPTQINVIGFADKSKPAGNAYLIDDGAPFVLTREALARARAAVRKERHRLFAFTGGTATADPVDATRRAIADTAHGYRVAPFKGFAGNFGLRGLAKMARLMDDARDPKSWPRVFDTAPLAFRALLRTWECATLELTPPGGGRHLYARFLDDAAALPGLGALRQAAGLARASGAAFDALAARAVELGGAPMRDALALTRRMAAARDAGAGVQVAALRRRRDALAARFDADAGARREIFKMLGAEADHMLRAETALADALDRVSAGTRARAPKAASARPRNREDVRARGKPAT